jgi:hypothetical protein
MNPGREVVAVTPKQAENNCGMISLIAWDIYLGEIDIRTNVLIMTQIKASA